jgi:thiamine-monophosphate kinase
MAAHFCRILFLMDKFQLQPAKRNPGERALLERIRARAARSSTGGLRLGIGDDCALLAPRAGEEIAVTTDLSIAGRHFRLDWHTPESVGHRALARGLSDLAAMGARPVAAFLSLGVPRELTIRQGRGEPWVEGFLRGLLELAERHKVPLAGGDLGESPLVLADIVLVGAVPRGKALLRSGARPGDQLYVTGALGGAAHGLAALENLATSVAGSQVGCGKSTARPPRIPKRLETMLAPHLWPEPRIAQGLWLRSRGLASAALDVSDGLSTDLAHLCEESGVAAELEAASLPRHAGASMEEALNGGEDYELLFTAPEGAKVPRAIQGMAMTRIGQIVKAGKNRPTITMISADGRKAVEARGWEHFA